MNERKTKTKNKHKVKESLCLGGRISSPLLLFSIRQLRGHHLSSSVDRQLLCLPCISFYFPQLADTLPNTKRNRKKSKKNIHVLCIFVPYSREKERFSRKKRQKRSPSKTLFSLASCISQRRQKYPHSKQTERKGRVSRKNISFRFGFE